MFQHLPAAIDSHSLFISSCVIVLCSGSFLESEWLLRIGARRLPIVYALVERVTPPPQFSNSRTFDLVGWDGATSATGFRQLVSYVTTLLDTAVVALPEAIWVSSKDSGQLSGEDWHGAFSDVFGGSPGRARYERDAKSVSLATSTPQALRRDEPGIARFVAYAHELESEVCSHLEQLADGQSQPRMGFQPTTPGRWKIGTPVTVSLSGDHVAVKPSQQSFEWGGQQNLLSFELRVLPDAAVLKTLLRFEAFILGIPVAFIPLELEIGFPASGTRSIEVTQPAKSAFASYASADQARVMDQLSAVCAYDHALSVFADCLDLRPGEEWQRRLADEIRKRDLFLLFWSAAASQSQWVTWEWRTAVETKGLSAIQPIPLDDPNDAPPPAELASLHFGSRYLLARRAVQRHA
jgi:hypothetical protein